MLALTVKLVVNFKSLITTVNSQNIDSWAILLSSVKGVSNKASNTILFLFELLSYWILRCILRCWDKKIFLAGNNKLTEYEKPYWPFIKNTAILPMYFFILQTVCEKQLHTFDSLLGTSIAQVFQIVSKWNIAFCG